MKTKLELVKSKMMVGNDEIDVDGYVEYHEETNYGADADGNRGEKRIFVDDVIKIYAWDDYKQKEVELTKNQLDLAAEILTHRFLEG